VTAACVDLADDVGRTLWAHTALAQSVEQVEDAHVDGVALDLGRIFHGRVRSGVLWFFDTWHLTRWLKVVRSDQRGVYGVAGIEAVR